jgi:hypothetical protein
VVAVVAVEAPLEGKRWEGRQPYSTVDRDEWESSHSVESLVESAYLVAGTTDRLEAHHQIETMGPQVQPSV